ncbi:MAG: hypothetical protein LBB47_01800 [Spirochaetaceae bacterium]|jgi:hypothetical protein|nr:hypothetical protein [Spirochaetaceae bacterium]
MKRIIFAVIFAAIVAAYSYSKDTPPYGENLFLLGFPGLISNAASTVGGGLYDAGPYSININPALTAPLQRVSADLGATFMTEEADAGFAFLAGALFPSRWGVWTGVLQGVFLEPPLSPPGNTFSARFGWARDIAEDLYVGASIFGGATSKYGDGFAAGLDLGFVYRIGNLGFLKDTRMSAALTNIGKTFANNYFDNFPGSFTVKGGFAAVLFENDKFAAGFSADVAVPTFQNILMNFGLELGIVKIITVSFGWDMNVRELADHIGPHTPFIGIAVKWTVSTGGSDILMKQGWEKTDLNVSTFYQRLDDKINLFSAGLSAEFGSIDKAPPVIKLGDSES